MKLLVPIGILFFATTLLAQTNSQPKPHPRPAAAPVVLHPHFAPGQVLRYTIELVTTTEGDSSGAVQDSAASGQLVLTWNATVRIDVLAPESGSSAAMRLRTTYEKSGAVIRSDSYDPAADAVQQQYQRLEGRVVEFALDAQGKVIGVEGLTGLLNDAKALKDAKAWIEQLSSGPGAGGAAATVGQQWTADQPADGLPLAGMVWRTTATYLRNSPCPRAAASPQQTPPPNSEMCAVIRTHLGLLPPKSQHPGASDELRARGMTAEGTWAGSGESLSYVSLRTGWVANVSQTGTEQMDVTVTTEHEDSLRYVGTVRTRMNLQLLPE
ncbi:MAG: hypothetical protein ACLP1Y_07090 [Candidatus Acidiferrales bacterium]